MKLFKKKEKEKEAGVSGIKIRVVINRLMSDVTPVVVAEFDALQQKDDSFNFQIINEDANFKEDLSMIQERTLDYLKYKLNLSNLNKEDSIVKIEEKIKTIDNFIRQIRGGKLEKEVHDEKANKQVKKWIKVNRIDLENELNHYKILKYNIETKGNGSYERINANGDREIQFATIEGVLYPYFWRSNMDNESRLLMYPDMTAKRKFYKESTDRITEDYIQSQQGFFTGIKGIIVTIIICVLMISGVVLNARVTARSNEINDIIDARVAPYQKMANDNAVVCGYYYKKLVENEIINRSMDRADMVQEINKKQGLVDIVDISKVLTDTK